MFVGVNVFVGVLVAVGVGVGVSEELGVMVGVGDPANGVNWLNPMSVVVPPLACPSKSVRGTFPLVSGPVPAAINAEPDTNSKSSLPVVTVLKFAVVYAVLAVEPAKTVAVSCIHVVRVTVPLYASVPLPPE